MNLRNQQQEMQKCGARCSEFTKANREFTERISRAVTTIYNKCCKSTATVQQKVAGVAGGTNKLNEEVKQLKGEINQKQVMHKTNYRIQRNWTL